LIFSPSTTGIAAALNGHFLTGTSPYITVTDPTDNSVKAIITSGDAIGSYSFANIPDGIGAFENGNTLNVFVNHELNNGANHGGFARVSQLKLDNDGAIINAEFAADGSEMYERFCSSSLVEGYGFTHPTYFTNEEVDDGIVVAVDGKTGKLTEMPWLGKFAHENTIHVPYLFETAGKTVVITTEDGEATESEVYMYVADTPNDLMEGIGQLYVFAADDPSTYANWDDIYYSTGSVPGEFLPLTWDHTTEDEGDLHAEATALGAFQFIRPEDAAMDKRTGHMNTMYMADTGNNVDENNVAIPPGSNGQTWERGRIYKFDFTDQSDPTKAAFEVIMDGNDPGAPGYDVDLRFAMSNPDNIDTSQNSLMIQEDRISVTRSDVILPYDMTKNAKIIRVDLDSIDAGVAVMEIVAHNNQNANQAAKHGDWESSGILDVSAYFGEGSWLVTVQAHSLQEGGQLLLLSVDGS
ncbi:MAG: hypothetical protein MN733_10015, partial [Nitrososphaera sp.]|nr:hypothetical protein [Nitrososphaera sp.]